MHEDFIPEWACPHWGQYEHDWLECYECLMGYESSLSEEQAWLDEQEKHLSPPQIVNWKEEGF